MINVTVASAGVVGDHTRLVELECKLTGFDRHTDGLHGHGRNQGLFVSRWNINKGLDQRSRHVGAVGHASLSLSRHVGVIRFGTKTSGLFIKLEGIVHETSVASQILVIAIQQVLFTQGHQFTRLDKLGTFQRTGRRKGPARSAGTLVLDFSDTAKLDPVYIVGQGEGDHFLKLVHRFLCAATTDIHLAGIAVLTQLEVTMELVLSHVRKLIVAQHGRVVLLGIVFFNLGIIVHPSGQSLLERSMRVVGLGVLIHP
mmetsp:Transcript_4039/g.8654  ORF Transcript_4039/g.8654 Transcript_4039/m.8654 type:complete len:256 (-) Transcript_4039:215-982(-)